MGVLNIRDLKITCIVGIYPREREVEQDLFVDVEMEFDFARVEASDHIDDTLDYTDLAADLTAYVRAEKFGIIETLAARACARILERHAVLRRCRFTVRKPGAVPNAWCAEVVVERARA